MKAPRMLRPFSVLLAAGSFLFAASCTIEREIGEEDNGAKSGVVAGSEVAFEISGIQSRATVTTALRNIGVFGYSHSGTYAATGAGAVADYFLNASVIDRQDNGQWTYSGATKYWPTDGRKLTFFAYAPFDALNERFTLHPESGNVAGAPTITYTAPSSVYNQVDILYDMVSDQTAATNGGTVPFMMDHALTRIAFQVKLKGSELDRPYVVTINELSVQNVVGSGTLDLSKALTDNALWTPDRPADETGLVSYTLTPAAYGGLNALTFDARDASSFTFSDLLVADQYLMLVPQPLAPQADALPQQKLVLKFTVVNDLLGTSEDMECELLFHTSSVPSWQAGKAVNYQVILSVVDDPVIEFEVVSLTPWSDGNNGTDIGGSIN